MSWATFGPPKKKRKLWHEYDEEAISSSSSLSLSLSPKTTEEDSTQPPNLNNDVSVLVVDDDEESRKLLMSMLSWAGVRAHEAENGQEAVKLYITGSNFHVIIIKKNMPVMGGPQATRMLRLMSLSNFIVGFCENGRVDDQSEFMEAGANVFYGRPLTRQNLVHILQQADYAITHYK